MTIKKRLKNRIKKAFFRSFFVLISIFSLISFVELGVRSVYAEPEGNLPESSVVSPGLNGAEELVEASETSEAAPVNNISNGESCKKSLGAIGWLVCPTTGKIAEAVDWLYEKIEDILVISPIHAENGSPIYEIWKYLRGITNIVFIIFLLVVIYSQITGLGINNYGIKKVLPKLIIAAVLVNFSFLICQVLVDVSNVVGDGLRGVFTSISEVAIPAGGGVSHTSYAEMYSAIGGMTAAGIGAGIVAIETGAIWMLIPVVLGALVAVVSGLITIALRQAVVALLIMISPLAMVAFILPNTEKWFTKWRDLLFKMLVFYPMFSLLFGASQLAGFAIIASAKNGFGMLLGMAVEIFPLFFSWSLMKMSGTFLNTINAKLNALAARPLAATQTWADSHRQLTKAKFLASGRPLTPTLRLMQFSSNRKIAREAEIKEKNEIILGRGLAYKARRNYLRGDVDGVLSKEGEDAYADQARAMEYKRIVERDKNNFNKGFGYRAKEGTARRARLDALDKANVNASDMLKGEMARGAAIEYNNAKGFHERYMNAMNAHADDIALKAGNMNHQFHNVISDNKDIRARRVLDDAEHLNRYNQMKAIMEGEAKDVHFVGADAAHAFSAQSQVLRGKFKDYFDYTVPTQDVVNSLKELTTDKNSSSYIDSIIAGMRTLNMRGDTDLIKDQLNNVLSDKKVQLGTYASQSLANFLMFDVKDNDPFLRRFGKYINLETARIYDEKKPEERRTKKAVDLYEYVNGEYIDEDENGNVKYDEKGNVKKGKSKRSAAVLLSGTSFKGMERTAIADMTQAIREQSYDIDENGNKKFSLKRFMENEDNIWKAILPNIIGDQFSFLSGSEQIVALGKGLTGMDVKKHKIAWNDIFGEEIAGSLTEEEKGKYLNNLYEKRTKKFLEGHVPVQIAKSKSDILEAIKNQLAFKDEILDDEGNLTNPDALNRSYEDRPAKEYESFEKSKMDSIKKKFTEAFTEDAKKGFAKMYHKGYQGEAKEKLIELLDPEGLYKKYFPNGENGRGNNRRGRRDYDDEDDDGMPIGDEADGETMGNPIYNDARMSIESINEEYRGQRRLEVDDYWSRVKDVILSSTEMDGMDAWIEEVESSLPQYNDVSTLHNRIMRELFDSD